MTSGAPPLWHKGGVGYLLVWVNLLSLCSQAVQLGAMPALIALRLDASGYFITILGIVAAAPWVAVLLLCRWVPRLLGRYGYFRMNAVALGVSAIGVLIVLCTRNPVLIVVANLCLGSGLIVRWIACDSWVIALAPDAVRGRAIGIHETLMGCGIAAGPLVIAVFGSTGSAPLVACLGLLVLSAGALLAAGPSPMPQASAEHLAESPLRGLRLMALAAFIAGFTETSSVSLLPVLSLHSHWPIASTLALAIFAIGGILLQLPIGYLADAVGFRITQTVTAAFIVCASVVLMFFGHAPLMLLPALFLLGGAAGGMNTLAVIEAGVSVSPSLVAAAAVRIALAYTVGSIVGPSALGALVAGLGTSSFPLAFVAIGILFCCARALQRRDRSGPAQAVSAAVKTTPA